MKKLIVIVYCCFILGCLVITSSARERQTRGLVGNLIKDVGKVVHNVLKPVGEIVKDITENRKTPSEPDTTGDKDEDDDDDDDDDDDEEWFWLYFDDYLDEGNRTVVDTEKSPIKFVETSENRQERSLSRQGRKLNPFVPIKKINGTNLETKEKYTGPKLYTGVFYIIGMKSHPMGSLVLSNRSSRYGYNHVEIDLEPDDVLENLKKGGSKEHQNEWMFLPSEFEGWYTWHPRAFPRGLATYTERDGYMVGNHVSVADHNSEIIDLLPGRKFRQHALWRPVESDEKGFYHLEIRDKPKWRATSTVEKHGSYNHWIEIAEDDYGDDSKFNFTQGGIILDSAITSVSFERTPEEVMNASGSKKKKVDLHTIDITNPNTNATMEYVIAKTEIRKASWTFALKTNIEFSSSISVQEKLAIPFVEETHVSATFSTKVGFEVGHQAHKETEQSFGTNIKLIIPAKTSISGVVYYEWLEDMELNFNAVMDVKGTAARLANDGSGKISPGEVHPRFVKSYLKANYNQVGEVDEKNGVFKIKVSGTLKGSMGTKTIVAINGPPPEDLKILGKHTLAPNKPTTTTPAPTTPKTTTTKKPKT